MRVVGGDADRLTACLRQKGVEAAGAPFPSKATGSEPVPPASLVLWTEGGCEAGGVTLQDAVADLTSSAERVLWGFEALDRRADDGSAGASVASWLEAFSTAGFEPVLSFDTTFAGPSFLLLRKGGAKHSPETRALVCEALRFRTLASRQQEAIASLSQEIQKLKPSPAGEGDQHVLKRAVAILDERVNEATMQIEALYASRIWKVLQLCAGWMLRAGPLFGRGKSSEAAPRSESRGKEGDATELQREEYARWILLNEPSDEQKDVLATEVQQLAYRPRISIVLLIDNPAPRLLSATLASVHAQRYQDWELWLVHDHSLQEAFRGQARATSREEPRVRVLSVQGKRDASDLANAALSECTGDFVGFIRVGDELADLALLEVVRELNRDSRPDVLYCDEDKLSEAGHRVEWNFKPDWSPDLLRSFDYVGDFVIAGRELIEQAGGWREGFSGTYGYDLLLRLSENAKRIRRIPSVLYHARSAAGLHSPETVALGEEARQQALEHHLARTGRAAEVEKVGPAAFRVRYRVARTLRVTAVVPTARIDLLRTAMEGLRERTSYENFGIVVVDNSRDGNVKEFIASLDGGRVAIEYHDARTKPFELLSNVVDGAGQAARCSISSPSLNFFPSKTWTISSEPLSLRQRASA